MPTPRERCGDVVSWLLGGTTAAEFIAKGKHKSPFVIHGLDVAGIWSTQDMLDAASLRLDKSIHYTTDVNVVKYVDGTRITRRADGVVTAPDLTSAMTDGWSVRFLRPAEHHVKVSNVIHCMEEEFQCHCGANTYYTPKGIAQGFAPHFDDVDVFIVQTEGEKEWFVYNNDKCLPRYSSEDFVESDLPPPDLHLVLQTGDMLYLPRGAIHQARSSATQHSLHITFSANQCHTYADYLHALCRVAVESVAANNAELRTTLPLGCTYTVGSVARTMGETFPVGFREKIAGFVREMSVACHTVPILDHAMDSFVRSYTDRRQPPIALGPEGVVTITKRSKIRAVCKGAARMVLEAGECRVVTVTGSTLRFEGCFAAAVATILAAYPKASVVRTLPMVGGDDDEGFTEEDASHNRTMLCEALVGTRAFVLVGE